jgi:CelD/BcsL family acetyltransferase involved in cellulose biosynthesis
MSAHLDSRLSEQALATIASVRRASAAERTAGQGVTVEIKPLTSLSGEIEAWRALAGRALEPNVFLEPTFALAAAPALGANVQAGQIWSQSAPHELLGLFPVRIEAARYGLPLPVLCSWTHPYAPFGTPLVHRDAAEPAISSWLDHIARNPSLPGLMLMPYVHDDGAFAGVLDAVVARRGSANESFDRHQRALLAPADDRFHYLDHAIAPKRRKELARQWRRMQDLGPVAVTRAETPGAATAALADFFRLEANGWKGRAGSAADNDPGIRQFVTQAVSTLAAQGQTAVHRLCIGDQAIAACITLRSGHNAWCWKIAYDEGYARFSPGAQLLVHVTNDLLGDATITSVDSLATPEHPLIDHIWRERCTMSDRLIALRTDSFVPFSVISRLEAMRRLGRSAGRSLRAHLRGR